MFGLQYDTSVPASCLMHNTSYAGTKELFIVVSSKTYNSINTYRIPATRYPFVLHVIYWYYNRGGS